MGAYDITISKGKATLTRKGKGAPVAPESSEASAAADPHQSPEGPAVPDAAPSDKSKRRSGQSESE